MLRDGTRARRGIDHEIEQNQYVTGWHERSNRRVIMKLSKLDAAIDASLTTWERQNPNPTREQRITMLRELTAAINGDGR